MATAETDLINSIADAAQLTGRNEEVLLAMAVALVDLEGEALTRVGLARRLDISASAVSRHIDKLRGWYLVDTSGYGLRLTPAGERRAKRLNFGN